MQKLHTELMVLCDYASVSREGKLSINGVFDEVWVQNFPGGVARAFLVATISGTPNTNYKLDLKVKNNVGAKSPINSLTLDTTTAVNGKNNLIVELINLGFEKTGEYEFELYNGSESVGSTTLKVDHVAKREEKARTVN